MKRAAGLLVATGLLVTASYSLGKPSAQRASLPPAKKSVQSKSTQAGDADKQGLEGEIPSNILWTAADRDRDGIVSFGEFATVVNESIARRVAVRFKQLDRNQDGRCTRAEVNKMAVQRFARFDTNRDGVFTFAELYRVMRDQLSARLGQVYARLDRDGNGSFSVAELTLPPQTPPSQKATGKAKVVARRGPPTVQ